MNNYLLYLIIRFLKQRGILTDILPTEYETILDEFEKDKREINMVQQAIKYANVATDESVATEPVIVSMTPRGSRPPSSAGVRRSMSVASFNRPGSSMGRPGSAIATSRPGSAMVRPGTASMVRPGSATTRPSTASFIAQSQMNRFSRPQSARNIQRPMSSRGGKPDPISNNNNTSSDSDEESTTDSSSTLTYGSNQVFCGNPIKALRKRKQEDADNTSPIIIHQQFKQEDILDQLISEKLKQIDNGEYFEDGMMSSSSDEDEPPPPPIMESKSTTSTTVIAPGRLRARRNKEQ
jgi:hypothetical protein